MEYTKADVDDGDTTTFSLAGPDASAFDYTVDTGNPDNLTVAFKNDPDFDMPGDANRDNLYEVSVVARDKAGLTGMVDLTIMVADVQEDGTVSLSTNQPAVGRPVTAALKDPDGNATGLKWQWERSLSRTPSSFVPIDGATVGYLHPRGSGRGHPVDH